jgi:hypothetical protein
MTMELRCPDCVSPEVTVIGRRDQLGCGNCGTTFTRDEAFASVADAESQGKAEGDRGSGASVEPFIYTRVADEMRSRIPLGRSGPSTLSPTPTRSTRWSKPPSPPR